MDYKYIEQLLTRYWNCETSLQEESILRNFFAQNDVPAHLLPYKSVFDCQQETAVDHLSQDFDERILALTEGGEEKVVAVKARRMRFSYGIRPFFKAAACVAVVLSVGMAVQQAMYQGQNQTENVVNLPPAVVPGAPSTAFENNGEQVILDSLERSSNTKAPAQEIILIP